MKTWVLGLVGIGVVACGGEDPYKPELSTREATESECAAGGTVMQLDGEDQATVCNGTEGEDGARGATGAAGPAGADGAPGPAGAQGVAGPAGSSGINGTNAGSSNVISTTVLCQVSDNTNGVFLSAYIWVLDAAADPTDNIGMCSISEIAPSRRSQTSPMIGTNCSLVSDTYEGVITIDFAQNPPVLGGAATGTMNCN